MLSDKEEQAEIAAKGYHQDKRNKPNHGFIVEGTEKDSVGLDK